MDELTLQQIYKRFPGTSHVSVSISLVEGFGPPYFSSSVMIHIGERVYMADWGVMAHHRNTSLEEALCHIESKINQKQAAA